MKTTHDLRDLRKRCKPVFLAAGFFDGLHKGHVRILARALADARRAGGEAWVLTFHPHPERVLAPATAPRLLTSTQHRLELFRRLGFDGVVVLRFTRDLAARPPEAFARRVCGNVPTLRALYVGDNWRFGRGGRGSGATFSAHACRRGFMVCALPHVNNGGQPVSSTRIRAAVEQGKLAAAARMLGRRFTISGTVVHGRGVGRRLGFPTANVDPHNEVLPPCGVYAARVWAGGRACPAALNLGYRPTFGPTRRRLPVLEAHLLDSAEHLYGRTVEVEFVGRLRAERRFDSPAALVRQVRADILHARRVLKKIGKESLYNVLMPPYIPPDKTRKQGTHRHGS